MKILKIQILTALSLLFFSCEKLVELDPPQDQLISGTVFESDETAISSLSGLYASMMDRNYPISYNIALFTGLCSDELEYSQSLASLLTIYKYAMMSEDALTNTFWSSGFKYIYQANAIIEGLNRSSSVSETVKRQLLGEAYFLRAFWNYYLSNLFGGIPLVVTTSYEQNTNLTRSSIEVVHSQILADLILAKSLLSENYVAANSTAEANERIRPNTYTASALLARLYLEMNDYSKAEQESTRIISNQKYNLVELTEIFERTSKEAIWQLELPTQTNLIGSYEANYFTLLAKPSANTSQRCATVSSSLFMLFNDLDKRKTVWIATYTDNTSDPATNYYYPAKYKSRTEPAEEYTTPFRLAEVYLIRAESNAKLGLIDEAINDTDRIRARSGLATLKTLVPEIQQGSLLDSIANEKRRELFCEWGIRWFDLKRSDITEDLMKAIAAQKAATWTPNARVWPIPLNDVLNSANKIKQNEGYN